MGLISTARWCRAATHFAGRATGEITFARRPTRRPMKKVIQGALHGLVRRLLWLRRSIKFLPTPSSRGAHAIALTPNRKLVLVTLSYARGWRLPGGGIKKRETADAAVLRELREEIGMISHGDVEQVLNPKLGPSYGKDRSALFVVRNIVYRPRWSLEVAATGEFELGRLPAETAPATRRLLAMAAHVL